VVGTSADDARAKPLETRAGAEVYGSPSICQAPFGARNSPKFSPRVSADARAAMRRFVRPHQHLEIFFGIYVRPGFQQRAVQAALGQNFRAMPPPAPEPMMQTSYCFGERIT